MYSLTKEILSRIDFYFPNQILFSHEPEFFGKEIEYVSECISMKRVASGGRFVQQFEEHLSQFTGSPCVVGTVNATAALHLAMILSGVEAQDEVLVPSLTFVASANAIVYAGAVPHFVDVDEKTLGVDPVGLEKYLDSLGKMKNGFLINRQTQRRVKALVVVHAFGIPADVKKIMQVCARYNIEVIEDAAESLGSETQGVHTGTFAPFGVLSFNGNKTITCGGGGALLVKDFDMAKRARHLGATAKSGQVWEWAHDELGYNYRLPTLNAAIGCAQIEALREILISKSKVHEFYRKIFTGAEGFRLLSGGTGSTWNYWLNALIVDTQHASSVSSLAEAANQQGIEIKTIWRPLHLQKNFSQNPHMDLKVTMDLMSRILLLPSSPGLLNLLQDQAIRHKRHA